MKYLSILKDSFREAMDSKILYVTFGLTVVLCLILLSMSYRPVTAREEVELPLDMINTLVWDMQAQGRPSKQAAHADLVSFEQTNQAAEPWRGDYRFTVRLTQPEGFSKEETKQNSMILRGSLLERFEWAKQVEVKETWKTEGREAYYDFTVKGSRIQDERNWVHEPSIFFGALELSWFRGSLTYHIYWFEDWLVNYFGGSVIVLLGIVVTAFFIPNMLRKGTVDLMLSKPVTRPGLLVFKYVGGLTFLFVNTLVAIGGVWLVLGIRTGIWTWSFPATALILTFFFAILYAVSTLFAVLTRSAIVCILMTLLAWVLFLAVGIAHRIVNPSPAPPRGAMARQSQSGGQGQEQGMTWQAPAGVRIPANVLHAILPRTRDLSDLSTRLVREELFPPEERQRRGWEAGPEVNWVESLGVSLVFIAVMLGIACWRFSRKDF